MTISSHSTPRVKTPLFVAASTTLYAVGALVTPRAFPLVEPDSAGYIEFSNIRTAIYPAFLRIFGALGLGLEQITYVQLALFVLSLAALIAALLRAGMPRALTALSVRGRFFCCSGRGRRRLRRLFERADHTCRMT
jgi:hypothetical protein